MSLTAASREGRPLYQLGSWVLAPRPGRRQSTQVQMLELQNIWHADGHRFARWSPASRRRIAEGRSSLTALLRPLLHPCCMHVKGHGGVKGGVRFVHRHAAERGWVARFDIASYYASLDHGVLLGLVVSAGGDDRLVALVSDYLRLPDRSATGRGMVAGGAISPLLGALYLHPLDEEMMQLERRGKILYRRFMDDFVILASSRHGLRRAIRRVHGVLRRLRLGLHPGKRYIGRTDRGFDFLGYQIHPGRRLRPSAVSLRRLTVRARRLYEQGAALDRLRRYVTRWQSWLHGGLGGLVSRKGGVRRYWVFVLRQLGITGAST